MLVLLVAGAGAIGTTPPIDAAPKPGATVPARAMSLSTGDAAPSFVLRTLSGERFRLARLQGRPVVVNFWASWCKPCREEFPLLAKARARHRDEGLEIVGVTFRDIASDARDFARAQHASWPLVVDRKGDVAKQYGVVAVPQTFLIGRDGVVAVRQFGGYRSKRDLEADLADILEP